MAICRDDAFPKFSKLRDKITERRAFFERAVNHKGIDCLIWPYGKATGGYGAFRIGGTKWLVHRAVCTIVHGMPSKIGMEAAHSCNVRSCINPQHLRWATHLENMSDQYEFNTVARGENSGKAKLTENEAKAIKFLSRKEPQAVTAKRYGISANTVSAIQTGVTWKHV